MKAEKLFAEDPEAPSNIKSTRKVRPEVIVVRDWKEYLGEAFLIIFSVLLALILTELISSWNERKEAKEYMKNIIDELKVNKERQQQQYQYHLAVLNRIDSAMNSQQKQHEIVSNDEFHLSLIAPDGILYRYLDNVAWEVAKRHNISSHLNLKLVALLNHIYDDQDRIMKLEDEQASILLSRESRKQENAHATLILIRDNFHGWAVDRSPGLLKEYDQAIDLLQQY
jgi:hypothetical protein